MGVACVSVRHDMWKTGIIWMDGLMFCSSLTRVVLPVLSVFCLDMTAADNWAVIWLQVPPQSCCPCRLPPLSFGGLFTKQAQHRNTRQFRYITVTVHNSLFNQLWPLSSRSISHTDVFSTCFCLQHFQVWWHVYSNKIILVASNCLSNINVNS